MCVEKSLNIRDRGDMIVSGAAYKKTTVAAVVQAAFSPVLRKQKCQSSKYIGAGSQWVEHQTEMTMNVRYGVR